MFDLTITPEQEKKMVRLGVELDAYMTATCTNYMQACRVLHEARATVNEGHWTEWVRSFGIEVRRAQEMVQVFERFGDNPALSKVEKSKLFKLLTLPAGEETAFLEAVDVKNTPVRQLGQKVKEWRGEEAPAAPAADEGADNGSMMADMEKKHREELKAKDDAIEQLKEQYKDALQAKAEIQGEKQRLEKDLKEQEQMMKMLNDELQTRNDRAVEAERPGMLGSEMHDAERLDPDAFARTVALFIASNSTVPFSRSAFALMDYASKQVFRGEIRRLQGWLVQAMDAVDCEMEG